MAVFRVEHTRDYTVMSNHHLKDKALSLKAKGLLAMMLSFPEEWDYSERGLAAICKEGVLEGINENTTYVKNTRAYLLSALFNSATTLDSHYTMRVNHDMYG